MNACINSSIYICIHMYIWIWIYTHMYTCSCIYMYPALSRVNFIESNMKFDIYFFGSRSHLGHPRAPVRRGMPWKQGWLLQYVTVCCGVLPCVAAWCSLLQCARSSSAPTSTRATQYCVWIYVSFVGLFWHTLIPFDTYSGLVYTCMHVYMYINSTQYCL